MSQNTKVYQALLKARVKFGPVVKSKINPHFKNRYADLQDVLDAVEGPLAENGLLLLQRTDCTTEGVVLITEVVEVQSGERIESRYPLLAAKQGDPQALGGALTYARRYSALALLGLAPEDDDGNTASSAGKKPQQRPQQQPQKPAQQQQQPAAQKLERPDETDQDLAELIADNQVAYLRQEIAAAGLTEAKVCSHFKVSALTDLSLGDYRIALNKLQKQPA